MKIYIAGKITGDRKYRAKFREAADLAVFMPDYQESAGAMVEWAWCKRTGKDCALFLDMEGGGQG